MIFVSVLQLSDKFRHDAYQKFRLFPQVRPTRNAIVSLLAIYKEADFGFQVLRVQRIVIGSYGCE